MTVAIQCLKCAHTASSAEPLESGVFRCSECGARMAYGKLMPRLVVNVEPPHFITLSIDDSEPVLLDQQLAMLLAKNLLSVAV